MRQSGMLALFFFLLQAPETAESIMAKVAANQDRSQAARSRWVYKEEILGRMLRTNNKLSREERREYTVAPSPDGVDKHLVKCTGKYEKGGKYFDYTEPGFEYKDTDIDAELLEDLIDDLVNDKESKDGVNEDLFPLTRGQQFKYNFKLKESKDYKGRRVHRISFKPKDEDEFDWEGEVLVDAAEYQPVHINTKLSRGIPWGVKVFLGTNIKQLGFSVGYQRVEEGLWFPVSYGSEFRIDVLFGYKRIITMAMTATDFKKTNVDSKIEFDTKTEN